MSLSPSIPIDAALNAELIGCAADAAPPACDLCGSDRAKRLHRLGFAEYARPFDLWRCDGCGVVCHWPRLSDADLRDQYRGDYYVFAESPAKRWSRATQLYHAYLRPLESAVGSRRLLEVGSATGELLAIARARGWRVQGVEISADAADKARQNHGLDIHTGTIEALAGQIGLYEVIIATDVIEHVTSPRGFVAACRQALAPGGSLILETPNRGGFWSRVGGPRWIGYNRFHLYLFDATSLTRLLRTEGFGLIHLGSSTNAAHCLSGERPELDALVRWLPASLRWRIKRTLNRCSPRDAARTLREQPVSSLDEALTFMASTDQMSRGRAMYSHLRGDNLVVLTQRGES